MTVPNSCSTSSMTHNIPDSPPPSYNSISRQSSTRAPTSDISSNEETKNNDSGSASTKDQALGSSILDDVSEDEVRDVSDGNPPPISFSMGAVPPSQTTDPRSEETQWEDVEGGRPPRRHTTGHRDNVGVVCWCAALSIIVTVLMVTLTVESIRHTYRVQELYAHSKSGVTTKEDMSSPTTEMSGQD
ncbi:hypothetical protein TREMEDRAFT_65753 [Tremella mesenterica DSM 1558]|uniref:uncharacterized protein n=1 Tax=Tremella mesenterica (strain ATCC 24925 / CBS 8224 / DSM 1558 / NBRC 9311 / NRRL Y-6157 / RJB 2259-6 / UBC 559-6) TaxID=578456 RepID=UPI00032D1D47|nr:uncharacterized protein TREMEDRAFT_65753 [Tremella mesenterica DSM 1558]EIW66156.1 hypothetical protein TREMEDRAFT_65753 [Tremella mesenterica DSM 1558]